MNDFLLKTMQSKTNNNVPVGQSFNPFNDVVKVSSVGISSRKLKSFVNYGKMGSMDFHLIRYLPWIAKISRQVYNGLPRKAYASPNYVDKKNP